MYLLGLFHTLLTLLGAALVWHFATYQAALSFFVGSATLFLSLLMLGIGYGLIFKKKLVALAIGIIVFKYAILGIIIFALVKFHWFNPLWFSLGLASLVFSALFYAIREALNKEGMDNGI